MCSHISHNFCLLFLLCSSLPPPSSPDGTLFLLNTCHVALGFSAWFWALEATQRLPRACLSRLFEDSGQWRHKLLRRSPSRMCRIRARTKVTWTNLEEQYQIGSRGQLGFLSYGPMSLPTNIPETSGSGSGDGTGTTTNTFSSPVDLANN